MCTADCNNSQNESSSLHQLQLVSSISLIEDLSLAITQIFVWPFVYINVLMLFTFYRKQSFRTETRYMLFAHTLLTDVIFLILTDFVVILSYSSVLMPMAFCIPFCMLMETVSTCTPLTITAMCVERYVAICMPLRHSAISTTSRTLTIMTPEQWHRTMREIMNINDFIIILLTEFFCYLMIVLAVRTATVDKKSAGKGLRTISLHMFQLILCTLEIIYSHIEEVIIELDIVLYLSIRSFNFITFSVIARAVSPLVYGLRDENLNTMSTFILLKRLSAWTVVYQMFVFILIVKAYVM
uniref:G-protein coupled receptors family 1 profile domain-containing protein n=1 Tax=Pygocentrus nattereri TaxID=42514 RepID=A0A3B4D5W6_PYGNA